MMVGAFVALGALTLFHDLWPFQIYPTLQFVFMFFAVLLGCSILGLLMDLLAFRPLRFLKTTRDIDPLITSLGVSIFLQNAVLIFIGSQNFSFPHIFSLDPITVGSVIITYLQIFIITLAVLLMLVLYAFLQLTKYGKAIRAIAINPDLAQLMGINLNYTVTMTFVIASQLAAAAGVIFGLYYGFCGYNMGFTIGIKALTAAILGGMGNVFGAVIGGLMLGVAEVLGAAYISDAYKDAIAFIILMSILVFRPSGLLGEKSSQLE